MSRTYSMLIESLETRRLLSQVFQPATSADLTDALNQSQLGDTIVLRAGTTYTGTFTLPNKTTGSGYITITSSNLASLPPDGKRVSLADAANMPKIVPPAGKNVPAMVTAPTAHHYKLIGVEFTALDNTDETALLNLGDSTTAQNS